MLQLKNICKEYKTGTLVQKALDNVSLSLRDNEFVAILGPSGSGKSTLLNIVGGLDQYDSGDLIINGISTKQYKDRDWDSYRNHTIGFIFQSYNLIPHQSVLANVELALTISGISRTERRERAREALKKVGLGDQLSKKPNQLSGGQMQRVAIARALVNNPSILLADEPTGALDTETSIQVMDLLKEVAKDRLVVMVTHNPELANRYATRIVTLKDGVITSDSDPFVIDEKTLPAPSHKNMGKSSMSFLTALSLSFNNLMTKKARTILVSFAGSIGIIGIALIMALSNGVNTFIQKTERDTLSEYPLEIQESSVDLASMMSDGSSYSSDSSDGGSSDQAIERDTISQMVSRVSKNDLTSLKEWLDTGTTGIDELSRAIEYTYDVTPQIYRENGDDVVQVNPNKLLDLSDSSASSSYISSSFSTSVFSALPQDADLYEDAYDVKAGRWPENYDEAVVVLSQDGYISDLTLYTLGVKDLSILEAMVESLSSDSEGSVVTDSSDGTAYSYEELMSAEFRLVRNSDLYTYDESLGVWTDRSSDKEYVRDLVENGETIRIVGVVQPKAETDVSMLNTGICYSSDLVKHVMEENADSSAVQAQLASPDINIFTGEAFGEESSEIDPSSLFSIDTEKMQDAFSIDTSKLNIDMSSLDLSSLSDSISLPSFSGSDLEEALSQIDIDTSGIDLEKLFTDLATDYLNTSGFDDGVQGFLQSGEVQQILKDDLSSFVSANASGSAASQTLTSMYQELMDGYVKQLASQNQTIPTSQDELTQGLSQYAASEAGQAIVSKYVQQLADNLMITTDQQNQLLKDIANAYTSYAQSGGYATSFTEDFQNYILSDQGQKILTDDLKQMVNFTDIENQAAQILSDELSSYVQTVTEQISSALTQSLSEAMSSLAEQLPEAFSFDADAFQSAISLNMDMEQMQQIFSSMLSGSSSSYEENLQLLGYADENKPSEILIYPNDFDAKSEIEAILDDYNESMRESGQDDKVVTYTDIVGTLMTSVTRIVNVISGVLIAFVAISLVVSSIMIGVITHISVLERRKEIGILRAIGASKRNVGEIFNAETFITGLMAGLMGVGIALILLIPANAIILHIAGRQDITASLPPQYGLLLILLSIALTLLSGLFPARKASRSDPVAALRTE
ncbi:MAG: ATP-binding cassette domain-containing protein [Lachnospiraceae bacterium]|jgi:putative ABC transport system permease protein